MIGATSRIDRGLARGGGLGLRGQLLGRRSRLLWRRRLRRDCRRRRRRFLHCLAQLGSQAAQRPCGGDSRGRAGPAPRAPAVAGVPRAGGTGASPAPACARIVSWLRGRGAGESASLRRLLLREWAAVAATATASTSSSSCWASGPRALAGTGSMRRILLLPSPP